MRPLDQEKNPILHDAKSQTFPNGEFDSIRGYMLTFTNGSGTPVTRVFAPALPASLEVALITVDARTGKRLTGRSSEKPSTTSGDMWADVNIFYDNLPPEVRQGARIYSTVIDLHTAPR